MALNGRQLSPYAVSRTSSFTANSAGGAGRGLHRADSDSDCGHPAHSRGTRCHRHRADGHGEDRCFRSADSNEAGCVDARTVRRRGTRALVVAPTRELVVQIEENVRAYAKHVPLRMATVFGGVSERPQIEALRSGVDLVVATPGRLIDLMGQRVANFSGIEFLVLDEADRMLDMGFLPPIRRIVKALPQKRQTLMFSASLSREIEQLTHEFQQSPKIVQIGRRANPAETVTQFAYEVRPHLKSALLLHLVRRSEIRHGSCVRPDQARRRQDRAPAGEQRNQNGNHPFQSFAESAAPRVEGFQIRRGAGAGRDRHRRPRHRRGWDLACGELRFPDALGGLCPSHRTHRPRARHR